jgi:hypothetical protein
MPIFFFLKYAVILSTRLNFKLFFWLLTAMDVFLWKQLWWKLKTYYLTFYKYFVLFPEIIITLFDHLEMFLFCFKKKCNIIWTFRNVFVLFSVWMLPPRQRRLLRRRRPLLSGRKQVRPREEGLLARKCESEFNQYNLFNIQTTSW